MHAYEAGDRRLVDHLRRQPAASVGEFMDLLSVTATAVRQRLNRLMAEGLIDRELVQPDGEKPSGQARGRGRPGYVYRLTDQGRYQSGNNYDDLVQVMWEEIRSISDPEVRVGLVKRLATKLAGRYADQIEAEGLTERMQELVQLMGDRDIPVDLDESDGLPILTMLACPYPQIAEQDRAICAMEKIMISEVLGQGVRLSECRLDGDDCCSFMPSKTADLQPSAN